MKTFCSMSFTFLLITILTYLFHPLAELDQQGGDLSVHYQSGTTYYVDQSRHNASNSNTGLSEDQPWLTIQHAADIATAGDTVIVKAGDYRERVVPKNSGTSKDAKITFKAEPRRSVKMWGFDTVNSDYLRIEGFDITYDSSLTEWTEKDGVFIRSDYVEVVDNYFHDIPANAIVGFYHEPFPQAAYIADNTIYHVQMGIVAQGSDWIVERNEVNRLFQYVGGDCDYSRFFGDNHIFRNNYFHGTNFNEVGDAHVDCFQTFTNNGEHVYNILFEGNLCYDFHQVLMAGDIRNTATSHHLTVRNNIFAHGKAAGVWISSISYVTVENNTFADIAFHGAIFQDNSTNNVLRNNIFYNIGNRSYWVENGGQVAADHNLTFLSKPPEVPGENNLVGVDPMFVDPANNNFHLQSNSQAIDKGQNLPDVSLDFDQNPRPYGNGWDIGAYEFVPELYLHGIPRDETIYLNWRANITIPATTTWHIDYYTQTTTLPFTATDQLSTTRSATLTDNIINYQWYTVTLYAMLGETPWLSDTVRVMPTDKFVYLPLVLK